MFELLCLSKVKSELEMQSGLKKVFKMVTAHSPSARPARQDRVCRITRLSEGRRLYCEAGFIHSGSSKGFSENQRLVFLCCQVYLKVTCRHFLRLILEIWELLFRDPSLYLCLPQRIPACSILFIKIVLMRLQVLSDNVWSNKLTPVDPPEVTVFWPEKGSLSFCTKS